MNSSTGGPDGCGRQARWRSEMVTRSSCFNFRADRMRQFTRALALADFDGLSTASSPGCTATTMTVYDRTFALPVVFEPQTFSGNLADVAEAHRRTNLRLAETEKYAHVTYFFNCGREQPYQGEDRVLRTVAESRHLRLDAGDERLWHRGAARRRHSTRDSTRWSSATSRTRTWSGTPAASRRRYGGRNTRQRV